MGSLMLLDNKKENGEHTISMAPFKTTFPRMGVVPDGILDFLDPILSPHIPRLIEQFHMKKD